MIEVLLLTQAETNVDPISPTLLVFGALVILVALVLWLLPHLRKRDIRFPDPPAPDLPWHGNDAVQSLETVYKYALESSTKSIQWYSSRRQPKRIYGIFLRSSAILLTAFAGLVPILPQLGMGQTIPPAYATVALAVVTLCISLDHFGGFTSGWVRYMFAQQDIERLQRSLSSDWQAYRAKSQTLDIPAGLARISTFLGAVGKVIETETKQWAAEFQTAISEMERAAKEAAEKDARGAIRVSLTNHTAVDDWVLTIDDTPGEPTTSPQAARTELTAKIHRVRAAGTKAGQELSAETAVRVPAGEIVAVSLTLA